VSDEEKVERSIMDACLGHCDDISESDRG